LDKYNLDVKAAENTKNMMATAPLGRKTTRSDEKTFAVRMQNGVQIEFRGDTAEIGTHTGAVEKALVKLEKPCPIQPFATWKDFVAGNSENIVLTSNRKLLDAVGAAGAVSILNGDNIIMPKMRNSDCAAHTMVHEAAHIYNKDNTLSGFLRLLFLGHNPEFKAEATAMAFDGDEDQHYVFRSAVKFKALAVAAWFMAAALMCSFAEIIRRRLGKDSASSQ
jgi:hypothetical protein